MEDTSGTETKISHWMTEGLFYVDGLTHGPFQMRLPACKSQQTHAAFSLEIKKKKKNTANYTVAITADRECWRVLTQRSTGYSTAFARNVPAFKIQLLELRASNTEGRVCNGALRNVVGQELSVKQRCEDHTERFIAFA